MTDVMKEKMNPLVEEYRRINSKWVFFSIRVLSILYITNFCETRKKNSNAIQVFFFF